MGTNAIDCRKKAFSYAFQLTQDANIEGKLCKMHLDSPSEGFAKKMSNITTLSIGIDCLDDRTGDRITISEADFLEQPDEYLDDCIAELMWYREYKYETENWVISIKDDRKTWEILDYGIADTSEIPSSWVQLYEDELSQTHTIVKGEDGYCYLMPNNYSPSDVEEFLAQDKERILAQKN
jgi:hypothetical protein